MGLLLMVTLGGCASGSEGEEESLSRVYVGTGSGDPQEGIYTFQFDSTDGTLSQSQPVTPILNPSYLTLADDGEHLYSIGETSDTPTAHAFDVDPKTGSLSEINSVPAEGAGPCYISLDQTGQWAFVANYVGGNLSAFPVEDDGSLGSATQVVQHTGSGPNPDRQSGPHAHYVHADPQNQYVLAVDLGIDQVRIYPFDAETGMLDTTNVRPVSTEPGSGPRHLTFHPNGDYVYVLGELSGTVTVYDYNAEEGRMSAVQTISTVPEDFEGSARSAAIHVHPSGEFLYASNRGDVNDIVHYSIDEGTGELTVAGRQGESVQWPRSFEISPSGQYLLVGNRNANSITIYRINQETGALTNTGNSVSVPEPTKIEFAGG